MKTTFWGREAPPGAAEGGEAAAPPGRLYGAEKAFKMSEKCPENVPGTFSGHFFDILAGARPGPGTFFGHFWGGLPKTFPGHFLHIFGRFLG